MDKIRRFQQDTFYISTFNAISSEEHMRAQLQHHKDTGFNLVEFTFKDRETVLRALPICEELGLKSIVQDRDFGGIGFERTTLSSLPMRWCSGPRNGMPPSKRCSAFTFGMSLPSKTSPPAATPSTVSAVSPPTNSGSQ